MKNGDYYYLLARKNIKKYRTEANISQSDLAKKTGFTYQYIRDLKSLKLTKRPRLDTLVIIAYVLNIDIKQLLENNYK